MELELFVGYFVVANVYERKRSWKLVARVIDVDEGVRVQFLRKVGACSFVEDEIDECYVVKEDIVCCLPNPQKGKTLRTRKLLFFDLDDVIGVY